MRLDQNNISIILQYTLPEAFWITLPQTPWKFNSLSLKIYKGAFQLSTAGGVALELRGRMIEILIVHNIMGILTLVVPR